MSKQIPKFDHIVSQKDYTMIQHRGQIDAEQRKKTVELISIMTGVSSSLDRIMPISS